MIEALAIIGFTSIGGSLFQLWRFRNGFDPFEKTMAQREERINKSLAEVFRSVNRTRVEIKHAKDQLKVKKRRVPYQIIDGCISCGSCREACPYPIIEVGYPYRINSEECVGCDLCNRACPVDTCRPIYEDSDSISIYSDQGFGLYSMPRRESIRKLVDVDLAQRLHAGDNGVHEHDGEFS